ncbi:hypothetical protein HU200_039466 [Digitaria exilis]|uniref:Uncharacterized protein n=1 Tax=Digitaria exilis TaxID=1010633 RepID=A0A835BIL1_9POAL|nr:hypothetical protein HU200_039466 [Digitaria exilis]
MSAVEQSRRFEIFPHWIRPRRYHERDHPLRTAPKPKQPPQPATIFRGTASPAHGSPAATSHTHAPHRTPPAQHATCLTLPPRARPDDPPRKPRDPAIRAAPPTTVPGRDTTMGRRGKQPYYVEAAPPVDVNKNTEWFMYPGVWTTYILLLFFAWLLVLSVSGCSPGAAWTVVNLAHFAVSPRFSPPPNPRISTGRAPRFLSSSNWIASICRMPITYHFFHWKKGTPFAADDQGIYSRLTWWEQIDNGQQLTRNRKFLTVVPVVLYLIASHLTDYKQPMFFLNTVAVFVLVVAKLPNMHKVRIFGINADI